MASRGALAALALACALSAAAADAAPLTFAYTGTVTSVAALDPENPFPTEPDFGTPFSGTFTFDSAAADAVPGDPATGVYASTGGSFGLTLELGGLTFGYGGVTVSVTDGYDSFGFGGDEYLFGFAAGASTLISARITDFAGTMFSGDALPLTPPSLSGRFSTFLFSDIVDGNQVELAGSLTSLTAVATVPEPSTLLLLFAALGGVSAARRARHNPGR